AETEARCRIFGVVARGATVDQQSAHREHEWLDTHSRDERAVHRADGKPAGDDDGEGGNPIDLVIDDQIDEQNAEQRDHRADRKFYSANDDDEGLGDGEDAEQSDLVGGVGEIADQKEARIDEGDDRADQKDQDKQAQVFLAQDSLAYTAWPTAS